MGQARIEKTMFIRLLCCVVALSNVDRAQTAKEGAWLRPSPIKLSGIVTDMNGKPLSDAWVDHTGLTGQTVKTNAEGLFKFHTRAPAIVFRKDGFNGKFYRVERDAAVEVKLEPVSRSLKACPSSVNCVSLKGFMSEFCLPKVRGVNVTEQRNDIDYGQRQFVIQTPGGRKGIQHAAGPMWGSGLPLDEALWSAVEYSETDYRDLEGFLVVDARGKSSNGEYWRVLGRAFETASYRKLSADEARLLDKVLDGVCLRLQPPR